MKTLPAYSILYQWGGFILNTHYFFDSFLSSEKKIIKTSFSVDRNQDKFHYF